LEVIREQVTQRDRMIRLLSRQLGEIDGIVPLPIPESTTVYSAWMFGMSIDPDQFACSTAEFAKQLAADGIPGAGMGEYYLMSDACTFLPQNARACLYPFSMPPASRRYDYQSMCPTAREFLRTWIRWSTFCERYTAEHCELAARIVRRVAARNRV